MPEQSSASRMPEDRDELRQLADADQADRTAGGRTVPARENWPDIVERDRARRRRVAELVEAGALSTGADHYHAALVFQHGEAPEDNWRAHELARRAAELGERRGRWLAAAALDRWRMSQGRPQRYGTQYQEVDGRWVLWDVDPTITDQERAAWDVPPLATAARMAEQLGTGREPTDAFLEDPPLASLEVPGLRVEIKRWLGPTPPKDRPKPRAVPLAPRDPMLPGYLPSGLRPARLDGGFCALDADGNTVITWRAFPLRAGHVFVSGWVDEFGPAPSLAAAATCAGLAGIWIGVGHGAPEQLVVAVGAASCWVVSGDRGREELVRVADTLPPTESQA